MSAVTDAGREQRKPLPVFRTVLEVAAVVVFVLLIWNNFTLRRQQSRSAAASKSLRGFAVREQIGAIPATALDGKQNDLDLRNARGIVAVVNPGCDSCRELIASTRGMRDVHVLSVASIEETRAMAKDLPDVRIIPRHLGGALGSRLMIYPQLFVIDHGEIVRMCSRVEECR